MDKIAQWLKDYIDTHPFDPGGRSLFRLVASLGFL